MAGLLRRKHLAVRHQRKPLSWGTSHVLVGPGPASHRLWSQEVMGLGWGQHRAQTGGSGG